MQIYIFFAYSRTPLPANTHFDNIPTDNLESGSSVFASNPTIGTKKAPSNFDAFCNSLKLLFLDQRNATLNEIREVLALQHTVRE